MLIYTAINLFFIDLQKQIQTMKNLLFLFVFFTFFALNAANNESIIFIRNAKTLPNINNKGVYGIDFNYEIDFKALEDKISNDSIMDLSKFTLNITFSENGSKIKPALGYQKLKNKNGNLTLIKKYDSFDFGSNYPIKESLFIPLAAFNLSEGEHTINVLVGLNGTDALGNKYQQVIIEKNIVLKKKPTHKITFNIDYLEVNKLMSNGQTLDAGFYNTLAPDVSVKIMLANTIIWKEAVRDDYIFAKGPKSKNIQFLVSTDDEIRFLVEDEDIVFNDFIGELKIPVYDTQIGKQFTLNKQFNAVIDCVASYKVE